MSRLRETEQRRVAQRKQWMIPKEEPSILPEVIQHGAAWGLFLAILLIFLLPTVMGPTARPDGFRENSFVQPTSTTLRPTSTPLSPTRSSVPVLPQGSRGGFSPGFVDLELEGREFEVDRCEGSFCLIVLIDDSTRPRVWVLANEVGR